MLARQRQSFARLRREHDNLRAALRWLIDQGDSQAEQAWRMGAALRPFWTYGGIQGEGRVWLDELVSVGDSLPASVSRGKMLFAAANFHHKQANFDLARRLGERLLSEAITLKDGQLARWAYTALGVVALARGSFPEAMTFAELARPSVLQVAGQLQAGLFVDHHLVLGPPLSSVIRCRGATMADRHEYSPGSRGHAQHRQSLDLADHGQLHAAPRRHRIVLPPGSNRRLLGLVSYSQVPPQPAAP
jgi:hypothetical protein